jgi:hypothetical protein
MLEFEIHFTKTGNFFHFLSNLAEWHFSCRRNYNEIWLEKTGPLNDEEKQALRQLAKLLIKYHFSSGQKGPDDPGPSQFLGIPFTIYSDKEVWKKVEEWVEPNELVALKSVFEIFTPRFEKLWKEEKPKLAEWKTTLNKELAKKKYDNLEKDLEAFFHQKPKYSHIDVYLLMGVAGTTGGGANIGPARVTLEPTGVSTDMVAEMLNVLYHETAHLTLEHGHYQNLLEQFLQSLRGKFTEKHAFFHSGQGTRTVVNEAVMTSLLPEGYLAEKYFGGDIFEKVEKILGKNFEKIRKGGRDDFVAYRIFAAAKLYPVAKDYIENRKPVDEDYLQKVWEVFEDFSKRTC